MVGLSGRDSYAGLLGRDSYVRIAAASTGFFYFRNALNKKWDLSF